MPLVIAPGVGYGQGLKDSTVSPRKKEKGGMEQQRMPYDIVERTFQFALNIVRLCKECERRNNSARTLARHRVRSGTSVGAKVEEAQARQSRAD